MEYAKYPGNKKTLSSLVDGVFIKSYLVYIKL